MQRAGTDDSGWHLKTVNTFLAHFCERADLTETEITRLRAILDERTSSARRPPTK